MSEHANERSGAKQAMRNKRIREQMSEYGRVLHASMPSLSDLLCTAALLNDGGESFVALNDAVKGLHEFGHGSRGEFHASS